MKRLIDIIKSLFEEEDFKHFEQNDWFYIEPSEEDFLFI